VGAGARGLGEVGDQNTYENFKNSVFPCSERSPKGAVPRLIGDVHHAEGRLVLQTTVPRGNLLELPRVVADGDPLRAIPEVLLENLELLGVVPSERPAVAKVDTETASSMRQLRSSFSWLQ